MESNLNSQLDLLISSTAKPITPTLIEPPRRKFAPAVQQPNTYHSSNPINYNPVFKAVEPVVTIALAVPAIIVDPKRESTSVVVQSAKRRSLPKNLSRKPLSPLRAVVNDREIVNKESQIVAVVDKIIVDAEEEGVNEFSFLSGSDVDMLIEDKNGQLMESSTRIGKIIAVGGDKAEMVAKCKILKERLRRMRAAKLVPTDHQIGNPYLKVLNY